MQEDGSAVSARDGGDLVLAPCDDPDVYTNGTTVVTFGFMGSPPGFIYEPRCLRVGAGDAVTFSGNFAVHPLYPSRTRGTLQENPITGTSNGVSRTFTFLRPGYYGYYCGVHGASDDGSAMAGMIWVN